MLLDKLLEHLLLFFYSITDSYGFSIILLSLATSTIMLPLFWLAEKLQSKERQRKRTMQPALDKIKRLKNKQEKYFYTKEIYKQHNYSPYYSLVGLIGLLIQIPFFLAAFMMLENFDALSRVPFGPVQDLFRPDGLILVREQLINLLPFAMTFFNILATYLYAKNMRNNEKVQLVIIALIFLALLYKVSAALVLYWTMNNIFSIGKNWLLSRLNKEDSIQPYPKQESLFSIALDLMKRYQREVITLISLIAIYLLFIGRFIDTQLSECFTSVFAALFVILLLDILVITTFIDALQKNKTKRLLVSTFSTLIAFSHLIIVYARFSSLTAYSIFKLVIILQITYLLVYLLFNRKALARKITINNRIDILDICIFAIITLPLVTYLSSNQEYFTSIKAQLSYFAILWGSPLLIIVLFRGLLQKFVSKQFTFISLISIFFTLYSLPIITNIYKLTAETNIFAHLLSLIAFSSIFIFLYYKSKVTLSALSVILVTISIFQFIFNISNEDSVQISDSKEGPSKVTQLLLTEKMQKKPDIYLLIYDAYVNEKQMNYYGIDNSKQMQFLKESNFCIYDDIYTQWGASLGSMSRVLEMDEIQSSSLKLFREKIGNSTVDTILQHNGYKTHYLLSSYFYSGCTNFSGDYRLIEVSTDSEWQTILYSILLGEFKYDTDFKVNDLDDSLYYNDKLRIIQEDSDYPKFLYSHIHTPGHSQNSGKCLPEDIINYHNNVKSANIEMQEDINAILSTNRDAIIILAGDHGPYLTGDCHKLNGYKEKNIYSADLADRYGVFLAVKYPESYKDQNKDNELLQDIFFSIFSDLFNNKSILKMQPIRTTYSSNKYIPGGAIIDGIIYYGADKGKPLYWDFEDHD